MVRALLAAAALLLTLTTGAFAEDAPPDKSAYTLFNPVPDNLMRSFATDRPAKSSSVTTVDAGHFQYETDIASWTYDRYNNAGTTTSNLLILDPVLKVGLTNHSDLELAFAPINVNASTDRTTNTHNSAFGFGDITGRVKFNLFGNDGGDYAMAIVPYVKAPAADQHIGNGHWEGGGYMMFNATLPAKWSVTLQTELDFQENANLDGLHKNYQNLANFARPITDTVSTQIEFWSDVNTDRNSPTQYTLDLAGLWTIVDNLQLDGGVNIGLNKATPDLQLYAGLSQRF